MSNETILAEYLKENFPIEQMRYRMYKEDDIYYEVPTLSFRFSKELNESIYDELRKYIESFEGNLDWTEFKSFKGKKVWNHVICPRRHYEKQKYMFENNLYESDEKYFSNEEYKALCEQGVEDIPKLLEHIKKNFKPNLDEYKIIQLQQ